MLWQLGGLFVGARVVETERIMVVGKSHPCHQPLRRLCQCSALEHEVSRASSPGGCTQGKLNGDGALVNQPNFREQCTHGVVKYSP